MNFDFNVNVLNSVFSTFKHMLSQSYEVQEVVGACEGLSAVAHRHLSASMLYNRHMHRICNVVDYLINSDTKPQEQSLQSFEVKNLISEILRSFEETVASYSPVTIDLSVNLKGTSSILLSKSHFELVILNLLYCCIKTKPDRKSTPVKISISVTENKNNIVFHIRDNNKCINMDEVNASLGDSPLFFKDTEACAFATLIALSLRVAQKSAEEMNGSFVHTPLKHGNRYDIHLPKLVNAPTYMLCSPVPYVPTYAYYTEFFADLKLEAILKKVISCFDEEDEV